MIKTTGTVVFDMIGTCFSGLARQRLIGLGAPAINVRLVWAIALYSLNLAHISNNGVKTRKAGAFIVVAPLKLAAYNWYWLV